MKAFLRILKFLSILSVHTSMLNVPLPQPPVKKKQGVKRKADTTTADPGGESAEEKKPARQVRAHVLAICMARNFRKTEAEFWFLYVENMDTCTLVLSFH